MIYRTVIIDDDENARARLTRMLREIDAPCELIGEAQDGFEAIKIINNSKPDLVFLDIEMPGMNGFDALKYCPDDMYIIFTTAHSDFAIKAFETNAISYLLKPFSNEDLNKAIKKLDTLKKHRIEGIGESPASLECTPLQVLPVKTGDAIKLILLETIVYIKAEGKYTIIHTSEKTFVSNFSISELEQRLQHQHFIRVHKSYIVNLKFVVELTKLFDKKFKVVFTIPINENIIVSKNYYDLLKNRIGIV